MNSSMFQKVMKDDDVKAAEIIYNSDNATFQSIIKIDRAGETIALSGDIYNFIEDSIKEVQVVGLHLCSEKNAFMIKLPNEIPNFHPKIKGD